MENITTMTAATTAPAFGMPVSGSTCARPVHSGPALGWAGVYTVDAARVLQGTTVSIERDKGAFPGLPAWSPPTS